MIRRVSALAFALAVIAAPVLADVCEARCGEHALHGSRAAMARHRNLSHGTHAHVAAAAPHAASVSVPVHAHTCADVRLMSTAPCATHSDLARTSVSPTDLISGVWRACGSSLVESRHGPPGPVRSTETLRI